MSVVIADSSPLNYLTLIASVDLLHRLYGHAIAPQQVITEVLERHRIVLTRFDSRPWSRVERI